MTEVPKPNRGIGRWLGYGCLGGLGLVILTVLALYWLGVYTVTEEQPLASRILREALPGARTPRPCRYYRAVRLPWFTHVEAGNAQDPYQVAVRSGRFAVNALEVEQAGLEARGRTPVELDQVDELVTLRVGGREEIAHLWDWNGKNRLKLLFWLEEQPVVVTLGANPGRKLAEARGFLDGLETSDFDSTASRQGNQLRMYRVDGQNLSVDGVSPGMTRATVISRFGQPSRVQLRLCRDTDGGPVETERLHYAPGQWVDIDNHELAIGVRGFSLEGGLQLKNGTEIDRVPKDRTAPVDYLDLLEQAERGPVFYVKVFEGRVKEVGALAVPGPAWP